MVSAKNICSNSGDKSPSPEPFKEPEGLVTIDLNNPRSKNEGVIQKVDHSQKRKLILQLVLGLFLLNITIFGVLLFVNKEHYIFKTIPSNNSNVKNVQDVIVPNLNLEKEIEIQRLIDDCLFTKPLKTCCVLLGRANIYFYEFCVKKDILFERRKKRNVEQKNADKNIPTSPHNKESNKQYTPNKGYEEPPLYYDDQYNDEFIYYEDEPVYLDSYAYPKITPEYQNHRASNDKEKHKDNNQQSNLQNTKTNPSKTDSPNNKHNLDQEKNNSPQPSTQHLEHFNKDFVNKIREKSESSKAPLLRNSRYGNYLDQNEEFSDVPYDLPMDPMFIPSDFQNFQQLNGYPYYNVPAGTTILSGKIEETPLDTEMFLDNPQISNSKPNPNSHLGGEEAIFNNQEQISQQNVFSNIPDDTVKENFQNSKQQLNGYSDPYYNVPVGSTGKIEETPLDTEFIEDNPQISDSPKPNSHLVGEEARFNNQEQIIYQKKVFSNIPDDTIKENVENSHILREGAKLSNQEHRTYPQEVFRDAKIKQNSPDVNLEQENERVSNSRPYQKMSSSTENSRTESKFLDKDLVEQERKFSNPVSGLDRQAVISNLPDANNEENIPDNHLVREDKLNVKTNDKFSDTHLVEQKQRFSNPESEFDRQAVISNTPDDNNKENLPDTHMLGEGVRSSNPESRISPEEDFSYIPVGEIKLDVELEPETSRLSNSEPYHEVSSNTFNVKTNEKVPDTHLVEQHPRFSNPGSGFDRQAEISNTPDVNFKENIPDTQLIGEDLRFSYQESRISPQDGFSNTPIDKIKADVHLEPETDRISNSRPYYEVSSNTFNVQTNEKQDPRFSNPEGFDHQAVISNSPDFIFKENLPDTHLVREDVRFSNQESRISPQEDFSNTHIGKIKADVYLEPETSRISNSEPYQEVSSNTFNVQTNEKVPGTHLVEQDPRFNNPGSGFDRQAGISNAPDANNEYNFSDTHLLRDDVRSSNPESRIVLQGDFSNLPNNKLKADISLKTKTSRISNSEPYQEVSSNTFNVKTNEKVPDTNLVEQDPRLSNPEGFDRQAVISNTPDVKENLSGTHLIREDLRFSDQESRISPQEDFSNTHIGKIKADVHLEPETFRISNSEPYYEVSSNPDTYLVEQDPRFSNPGSGFDRQAVISNTPDVNFNENLPDTHLVREDVRFSNQESRILPKEDFSNTPIGKIKADVHLDPETDRSSNSRPYYEVSSNTFNVQTNEKVPDTHLVEQDPRFSNPGSGFDREAGILNAPDFNFKENLPDTHLVREDVRSSKTDVHSEPETDKISNSRPNKEISTNTLNGVIKGTLSETHTLQEKTTFSNTESGIDPQAVNTNASDNKSKENFPHTETRILWPEIDSKTPSTPDKKPSGTYLAGEEARFISSGSDLAEGEEKYSNSGPGILSPDDGNQVSITYTNPKDVQKAATFTNLRDNNKNPESTSFEGNIEQNEKIEQINNSIGNTVNEHKVPENPGLIEKTSEELHALNEKANKKTYNLAAISKSNKKQEKISNLLNILNTNQKPVTSSQSKSSVDIKNLNEQQESSPSLKLPLEITPVDKKSKEEFIPNLVDNFKTSSDPKVLEYSESKNVPTNIDTSPILTSINTENLEDQEEDSESKNVPTNIDTSPILTSINTENLEDQEEDSNIRLENPLENDDHVGKKQLQNELSNNNIVNDKTNSKDRSNSNLGHRSGDLQSTQQNSLNPCFSPYRITSTFDGTQLLTMMPSATPKVASYVINPPVYPYVQNPYLIPQQYLPTVSQPVQTGPLQVAGQNGQFYICNPIQQSTNNIAGLPGVEVRRDSNNLQDLLGSVHQEEKPRASEMLCPFGYTPCSDESKCIPKHQVCDNEAQCNDGSDEMFCTCKQRVGKLRSCDGYFDCPQGEDELGCFGCEENEFSCDDWSKLRKSTCIPREFRCDNIKQCEITGKDEEDCSSLADSIGDLPLNTVSNSVGFLHRNYKGKWYPTCFGTDMWAQDVCKVEAGPTSILPKLHMVLTENDYNGDFINVLPNGEVSLVNTCVQDRAAFVECPPLFCGMRISTRNPYRKDEVDVSAENFINDLERQVIHRRTSDGDEDFVVGDSRVVGGSPSQPAAWPWLISIYRNGVFHCGGVIIDEAWIVTAAHCVDRYWLYYYEIQAGVLRRFSYAPMEQHRWAVIVVPNENYDRSTLKNDIALMKLSSPVRFNRYVRPICLPSVMTAGSDFTFGPAPGTICTTVGWGATMEHGSDPDHMRQVEVPILDHCKHSDDLGDDEICAGLQEGGKDACQGDSGGPLMCRNPNNPSQWYLAGIVSHGEGCARPDEPGVYTKVGRYVGWIMDSMGEGRFLPRFPLRQCPGYVCKNTNKCIPKKHRCDKLVDCLFGDDETNCRPNFQSFFTTTREDDRDNLLQSTFNNSIDSSTENKTTEQLNNNTNKTLNKESGSSTGNKSEPVNNTVVIEKSFICKSLIQEIPFNKKCNKIVDCEDGTDESDCKCTDYVKSKNPNAICDGITDCYDLSDEQNCGNCKNNEFHCRQSKKCIDVTKRCDGMIDCAKEEDEWDCVVLTNGKTLAFDSDSRPQLSISGIISINKHGIWRPLCLNITEKIPSTATNVCVMLGFEDYFEYHEIQVEDLPLNTKEQSSNNTCTGLLVKCSNVSLDTAVHSVHSNNITDDVELYTSPWNAVIYSDGIYRCMGAIVSSRWIVTSVKCFQGISMLNRHYVAVLLGKGKAALQVKGPHEQTLRIVETTGITDTDIILLRTDKLISFSRYIKQLPLNVRREGRRKEKCVAIGVHDNKAKYELLTPIENCMVGYRCFEIKMKTNCTATGAWSGTIFCDSGSGWYPAAVYSEDQGLCGLTSVKQYTSLPFNKNRISKAMELKMLKTDAPECKGFRCELGECISKNKTCDGIQDCRGGEDEEPSLCYENEHFCHLTGICDCNSTELRCKNNKCIPKQKFCDRTDDCGDLSDEPDVCNCRAYLELTNPEKICDGILNCMDGSDEDPHFCPCTPTAFKCISTEHCVADDLICDGYDDCPNGEDEILCYNLVDQNNEMSNAGELITRTGGIWHSGCFNKTYSSEELNKICTGLSYKGVANKLSLNESVQNMTALRPIFDNFEQIWFRQTKNNEFKLKMRTGYEPIVKFVEDKNCYKLFLTCI